MATIKPYEWQLRLIKQQTESLEKHRFFVNACGTGAGKTVMALQTMKDLYVRFLVVAPIVSHEQWRRTARAMDCEDLLLDVINIEKISRGSAKIWFNKGEGWKLPHGAVVILDECHRGCSGEKSNATEAFALLKAYPSIRLLAMSATLASNPMQLRMAGYWAGLHGYVKQSYNQFLLRHGCKWEQFGWGRNRRYGMMFTRNPQKARDMMAAIRREFGEMIMAYGPKDIPDFPTETILVESVDLSKRDRDEIEDAYAEMSDKVKANTGIQLVDCLHERMRAELCKAQAMVDLAVSYVNSITDNYSVVMFLSFTQTREKVEKLLREAGVSFRSVYGGMDEAERQAGIDAFQANEVHCLVCMSQAASCAMSAHDVKHERMRVSLISPSFSASDMKQALGRIRRVGGTHATQVFVLAAGTVEDDVAASLRKKIDNLDTLNDADLMPAFARR